MIMRNFIVLILISVASIVSFAQGKGEGKSTSAFYQYEAECEGSEMDGSQMVRGFGSGKNFADAKDQAKKNALYAVIFKGIRLGRSGCSVKPLVFNPNALDQNEDYFNDFFRDGGKFESFVSVDDSPKRTKIKEKSGEGREKLFGIIITINMVELKKELTSKGIIKKPE
jgi:hypothetical protein